MRAAFPAFFGCVMAVATVSARQADAAYPFDDLPSLPPLPGIQTAAFSDGSSTSYNPRQVVPASYDGGFTDELVPFGPSFDDGYYADPGVDYSTTDPTSDTTRRLIERFSPSAAETDPPPWGDPGFDPEYGPLDGGGDFDRPPSFDGAFAPGPPIWVGHVASNYMPGTDRIIWNGEWFVPLWQDGRNLWFFNLRGQTDDDDAGELNIGTGVRTLAWPGWVFGTYIFYDRLHSAHDNSFSQGTLGVEAMDMLWDFRFNVYFPESKAKATSTPASAAISNGTIVVRSGIERAYWGFDFETGRLLRAWGPNAQHEVRGFAGIYHFDHTAAGFDNITGPRVRLEWRWYDLRVFGLGSRLTCGFTAQADTERGGDLFFFSGLRVPLGPWGRAPRPLSPLQRRMLDPVVRDVDVVTNSIQRVEPAVNAHTGEVISSVHILDKTDDLADRIAAFDNDSVVVIDGTEGHIPTGSAIPLQPGQTVVGGGTQFDVHGALTGKQATWTAPGLRPTIEFGMFEDAEHGTPAHHRPMTSGFRMADHTQLASLNIRGGRPAVAVEEAEHVYLFDVDIRDAEGAGIALAKAHHVKIEHVSIDDVDSQTYVPKGWTNSDDHNGVFWAGSIHQGSGIAGVKSSDVTIRNSHIQETQQAGIKFFKSQDITVENTVIEDTEGPGLSFLKTENVTLHNIELHDVGLYEGHTEAGPPDGYALLEASDASSMPSTDWMLKRAGIELRETHQTSIHNVTIRGEGSYGIWADGAVDTTVESIDITEADVGMWFNNSQDVFVSGAHIEWPDLDPHWVAAWPDVGLFDFVMGQTVVSGDAATAGTADVPAQYHGIVLTDVTGSATIRDSHIGGAADGLGIWTQNHQDGVLDLIVGNNVIAGMPISLEAGGVSQVTARVWDNDIGGGGWSVNVDAAGTGGSNLSFFDNQLDGTFEALAIDDREMNLALEGNQFGGGPHMISNRDNASVYLQYRNNRSPSEVIFESMGSVFGLEPISGNDHTPTQNGDITPVP